MSRPELYPPPSRNLRKNTILSMEKADKILLFNKRWGWWSRNKKAENIGKVNEVKHCRLLQRQNNFAVTFLAQAKYCPTRSLRARRTGAWLRLSPFECSSGLTHIEAKAQFRHHKWRKEWDPDFLTDRQDPLFREVWPDSPESTVPPDSWDSLVWLNSPIHGSYQFYLIRQVHTIYPIPQYVLEL